MPTSTPNRFTHLVNLHTANKLRQCQLHVKPECIDEYVRVHQDTRDAKCNRMRLCNYSLFLREEDGLVIGYFEADDVEEAVD